MEVSTFLNSEAWHLELDTGVIYNLTNTLILDVMVHHNTHAYHHTLPLETQG